MKKKLCVVTGSRAEYGLLKGLMQEISDDVELSLQIVATGSHLCADFGLTYKEIEKDLFTIDEKVDIALNDDTPAGILQSMGIALSGMTRAYNRLQPDIIIVLGDRYEILAAVIAALINKIPVAHIGGGELTEGAFDESIRHAITKMSHLHFTSTEEYKNRVIQLGEHPDNVCNVGSIGVDTIRRTKLLSREDLQRELGLTFDRHNVLVTFHPVTLEKKSGKHQCQELLAALAELEHTHIIFTKANADTDGRKINSLIDDYVAKNSDNSSVFTSMGQVRYLSTLQFVDAVVGNSSSGIIEAPYFKIGTVNIGNRQKGRVRAASVIDCEPTKQAITEAFAKLYTKDFQSKLPTVANPHGEGLTSVEIKKHVKHARLHSIQKKFYDITMIGS